jgi:hypothetical protein
MACSPGITALASILCEKVFSNYTQQTQLTKQAGEARGFVLAHGIENGVVSNNVFVGERNAQ